MAQPDYDLLVIGDAPAGRLAAAILAREGRRILHLTGFGWPPYLLWPSSLLLERLLARIGGGSCLVPSLPVHVRQEDTCLLLHGDAPLRDELQREYPRQATEIQHLLKRLDELGEQLQGILLQGGLLPAAGWTHRWRWPLRAVRHGLPPHLPRQPLPAWLQKAGASAGAGRFVCGLLAAATLTPAAAISVAEAALATSQLLNAHGVAPAALDSLLTRRLTEAGVTRRSAADLTALRPAAGHWLCRFGGEKIRVARVALAGRPPQAPEGLDAVPSGAAAGLWHLEDLRGRVAAIHAPRLLVAGDSGPLQIAIGGRQDRPDIWLRTACDPADPAPLQAGLERLFPFTAFRPRCVVPPRPAAGPAGFCGRTAARTPRRLHLAAGERLYPRLGPAGEALAALELLAAAGAPGRPE